VRVWLCLILMFTFVVPVAAQAECPLPDVLVTGEMGEVRFTDGEPLNVRGEPGRTAAVVGTLREGLRFRVLSEPICSGGIVWREIEANALTGWIAEGVDEVYFVRPLAPALLEAEGEVLPAFDLAQIDSQTRLLLLDDIERQMTDSALNPLLSLPRGTLRTTISANSISAFVSASDELYTAYLADGVVERTIAVPTQVDDKAFRNAALSPDGEQIAWLYSNCESIFGCPLGTGYALSLTDAEGGSRRVSWEGAPMDVGRFELAGWRSDSGAVFLEITGDEPYPEPGSPVYIEPGYPPEGDVFEIPLDDAASVVDDRERRFAISHDGVWEVERETGNSVNELYVRRRDGMQSYTIPYPGYRLAHQFTFSPHNQTLVWAESNYSDNRFQSTVLKALNLETGSVTVLYEFPASYVFERGWLAENLLAVQWVDLQFDVNYRLVERLKATLVFDVTTGDVWRLELPEFLRAYAAQ
jgi:hypothetical protein